MIRWALLVAAGCAAIGLLVAMADVRLRNEVSTGAQWSAQGGPALTHPAARPEVAAGWNEVVVAADGSGHFVLEAAVNGTPVRFLVDTGASAVVLAPDDARRIGLDPRRLSYSQRFQTANGIVGAAPVTLREVRVGQFSVYELPASVNEAPLGISLLGVSFLSRLRGYEVRDDRLFLRW